MCGIFLHFFKDGIVRKEMMKRLMYYYSLMEHRGPDRHTLAIYNNTLVGFHRLAINDLSEKGDQPFELKGEVLMCNGEIYNYDALQYRHQFPLQSKSDCEIILHMFQLYGVEAALQQIDGVFAMIYVTNSSIYMIRDRIGVKPLFYCTPFDTTSSLTIASEPIVLDGLNQTITEVMPSTFIIFPKNGSTIETRLYHNFLTTPRYHLSDMDKAISTVHDTLVRAVQKRLCSDRPIGCLLSGGLDSSVIASILCREMKRRGQVLTTFSVGFPDSTDLVYARKVADYLQTDHCELVIQYNDAISYLPSVIKKLASYDTTTIRASTPMFMLCEWINTNFPHRVIFSGEGSDELFCGYLYSYNAPTDDDLVQDSIRLVNQLYLYDVLRADRCTAGNSLEFREPFLDQDLVQLSFELSGEVKRPKEYEKDVLRRAFIGYLPDEVLWRRKAAFSDAVSSSEKPWYKWIHEHVESLDQTKIESFGGTPESNYYKTVFSSIYKYYRPSIPLWLPQWSDTNGEPSATVLNVYKKEEH
jgi:asparagine synthase (glutamine-hydrolysing)